jgi:hypothetical protein
MIYSKLIEFLPSAITTMFLVYIAYQQMKINERKLNLDLYNKRISVYTDTLRFYHELAEEDVSQETLRAFIGSKEASKFLFSKDSTSIFELLDSMHSESFKIIGIKCHEKDFPGTLQLADSKTLIETYFRFGNQLAELKTKMAPYLNQ